MTTTDAVITGQVYHDEILGEFKASSYEIVKNLTKEELIENLKASSFQCSLSIAITGGKLNIAKTRVYPMPGDKAEIEFLESYLHVLLVWLRNAQAWLEELKERGKSN